MRRVLLVTIPCLLIVGLGSLAANGATATTEREAAAIASAFARAMGWDYGPPSQTKLAELPTGERVWEVEFSGEAGVQVGQETGRIRIVVDKSQLRDVQEVRRDAPAKLTELEARTAGERILDVVGRPTDIVFECVENDRINKEWRVRWKRTFQGIPYISDGVLVVLSPIDGELLAFGDKRISAPPEAAEVNLSPETAIQAARETAAALEMPGAISAAASVQLYVVQPDSYWGPGPLSDRLSDGAPSRVAWVVRLGDRGQKHFWIDAADGTLLGGAQARDSSYTTRRLGSTQAKPPAARHPRQSMRGPAATPIIIAALGLLAVGGIAWSVRRKRPAA